MRQKRNTSCRYAGGNPSKSPKPGEAKPRTRSRVRTPTLLYHPTNNVVLGIDSGEHPGYAVMMGGGYRHSGHAKGAEVKALVVDMAVQLAEGNARKVIFVAENWPSGYLPKRKRMSHASILGMGMNWGLWLQEIQKLDRKHQNIFRIDTAVWRKPYGTAGLAKKDAKDMAIKIASKLVSKPITNDNEAEAILIANVGCRMEV